VTRLHFVFEGFWLTSEQLLHILVAGLDLLFELCTDVDIAFVTAMAACFTVVKELML
jgi:hypothetical protein